MFKIFKYLTPLILIILLASMAAFGAEDYGNVGPTTNFGYDIGISDEIIAEGSTADEWETTILFIDPTGDRTITIPNYDVIVGSAILLTVTDNETTNEDNAILFTSGGVESGVLNIESDGGDFYYNPSTGLLTVPSYSGDGSALTGVDAAGFTMDVRANEDLKKGDPVYISGSLGVVRPRVQLIDADDPAKIRMIGVAATDIANTNNGVIRISGLLINVDTDGNTDANPNNENWVAGQILYATRDGGGGYTWTRPTSGRVIKAAYSLIGADNSDTLYILNHVNATDMASAAGEDIRFRLGADDGSTDLHIKNFSDVLVASIDDQGDADFTSLILDTALPIAEGGTGSTSVADARTALNVLQDAANVIDSNHYTDGSIDHEHLNVDVITGWAADVIADADTLLFYDNTGGDLNKITWTNLMGSITSILNTSLYVGRDTDNRISWATDDRLIIEIANVIHTFVDIETGTGDNDSLVTQGYVDDIVVGGGYTNLIQFVNQTAWRVFYSNTDGDVIELALGTDGQYLKSTGATSAPIFDTPTGTGTVTTSGTPVANDIARFTAATVIEGLSYSEFKTALDLEIGTDILAQQSIGITDNYLLEVDGSPNSTEYARFTANGLEGRTEAEFKGDFNLEIGTDIQAFDNALANLSGLVYVSPSFIKLTADDTYAVRTLAETLGDIGALANIVEDPSPELGEELDAGAHSIGFTLQTDTGTGAKTIDWRLGNKMQFTFGAGNVTFTFTAPTNPGTLMLTLIQDGGGSRTITWPGTVKFAGGVEPTLTTAGGSRDKVALDWDGTQYDAVASLDFK